MSDTEHPVCRVPGCRNRVDRSGERCGRCQERVAMIEGGLAWAMAEVERRDG